MRENTHKQVGWWGLILFFIALIVLIILVKDKRDGGQRSFVDSSDQEKILQGLIMRKDFTSISEKEQDLIIEDFTKNSKQQRAFTEAEQQIIINSTRK